VSQAAARLTPAQATALTQRAATASVAVAVTLIGLKGAAYWASGSVAVLASLVDSALDLMASLFTYAAVRYAAVPPDREHRFGHGKAEAFAGLFQAGLVLASAALVASEAIARLLAPQPITHSGWAIGVMLVSIALTAWLIQFQSRALAQTGSIATKGDRAHYAADLGANLASLAGIVAAAGLGWWAGDAAAGLAVAVSLAFGAWGVAREAGDHLMDRELPEEDRAAIAALALADPAVFGVHALRSRASGPHVHIQMHIDLDGAQTLSAAHARIVAAEARIRTLYPGADIIIHADPLDGAEPHGQEVFEQYAPEPREPRPLSGKVESGFKSESGLNF
jgi:ferrous-iron efflux pump FieF